MQQLLFTLLNRLPVKLPYTKELHQEIAAAFLAPFQTKASWFPVSSPGWHPCANTKPSTCSAPRSCFRGSVYTTIILISRLITPVWGLCSAVNQSSCVWTSIIPCGRWDSRAQNTDSLAQTVSPHRHWTKEFPVFAHMAGMLKTQTLVAQGSTRTNFGSCYLHHKYHVYLCLKTYKCTEIKPQPSVMFGMI